MFDMLAATGVRVEELCSYSYDQLVSGLGLPAEQAEAFLVSGARTSTEIEAMSVDGVQLLTRADPDWPGNLLRDSVRRAIPWLFVLGDPELLACHAVGIAGSRDATVRNLEITRELAASLSEAGRVIVSGGARGVDSAAHDAALAAGGRTVVVLAQGLGTFQVPWKWREPLREGRLAVVSEYLPLDEWESFRALQRNATIVQLGDAFIVVQAGQPSGTLSAGQNALKMSWPLHVVRQDGPGAETFPGNDTLIRLGGSPLDLPLGKPVPGSVIDQILTDRPVLPTSPVQLGLFA